MVSGYQSQETEQIVSYKPYMASLLHRLQNARALVSIQIGNKKEDYNSLVIGVDAGEECFYLDEISPEQVHRAIHKGAQFKLIGRIQGVYIEFVTRLLKIEDSNSIAMYRLALPEKLIYRQRRRHYRAHVNTEQDIAISFTTNFQQKIHGEIVDISASGICTRMDYSDSRQLEAKQAIHDATIRLPGRNYLHFDLEVCNIRYFPDKGYSLIGSKFVDIPPKQQMHVDRIVAMLDRNQRRSACQ